VTYQTEQEREAARRRSKSLADKRRREREGYKIGKVAQDMSRSSGSMVPPAEVLFDRDRRMNAARSLTAERFGDPSTPRWNSNAHRRIRIQGVLLGAALLFNGAADAHGRHHHYPFHAPRNPGTITETRGEIVAHPAGCPHVLFCGCGVCVRVFGHPCIAGGLAIADNWRRHFPRTSPHAGAVAIFGRYHVAYVEQAHGDGTVTLYDPNSGHGLTRIHRVSVAGLVFVDPRS
jgi:hypothetical protein